MPFFWQKPNSKNWQPPRTEEDPKREPLNLPKAQPGTKSKEDRIVRLADATAKVLLKSVKSMTPAEAAQYIINCAQNAELDVRALQRLLKLGKLPAEYRVRLTANFARILAEEEANRL